MATVDPNDVIRLLSDTLDLRPEEVTRDTSASSTPNWDSLGHLNVMLAIEQAFGVRLTPEQTERMTSVADICEVLRGLSGSNHPN
jgi:acyl carrier protein